MSFTLLKPSALLVALGLSATLILSGCASTGSGLLGGASADPRLTSGSDAQFFSKSGFQACATGAGVAALACLASNAGNKPACMLVAGIAACGVAMGGNYYLDQRRSEYANTNERLKAITSDVQADTQRIVARTETAYAVIQDDKRHLAQIQKQIATKQMDEAKAKTELAQIDQNIAVMNRDLANMTKRAEEYEKVAQQERSDGANKNNVAKQDKDIANMRSKINVHQSEVASIYDQRNSNKIG